MKRRLSANASLVSLALIASGIEPDPEIALIPIGAGPEPVRGETGQVTMDDARLPAPQSTNRYTRKGQDVFKFARELIPGLDVDTIKGMLRHEDKAWEKAEALLVKARTRS